MLLRTSYLLFLLIVTLLPAATSAAPGAERSTSSAIDTLSQPTGTGRDAILYFPVGDIYPAYAADPFRAAFSLDMAHVSRVEIPASSSSRINLRAGGVLGVLRYEHDPIRQWQVSLIGGFSAQFDSGHSLDNIGWDGHYGIVVTEAAGSLALKLALQHDSSHVGDEYIERTGRQRIGYTRQDVAVGASWLADEHWRIYSETGWAFSMGNEFLQKPWRGQLGCEYESRPLFGSGLLRWYTAIDSQSMQERDWRIDVAVQTGLVSHSAGRTWRLGLQWYNGRPPMGEFFQFTERSLSLGIWIDI